MKKKFQNKTKNLMSRGQQSSLNQLFWPKKKAQKISCCQRGSLIFQLNCGGVIFSHVVLVAGNFCHINEVVLSQKPDINHELTGVVQQNYNDQQGIVSV